MLRDISFIEVPPSCKIRINPDFHSMGSGSVIRDR